MSLTAMLGVSLVVMVLAVFVMAVAAYLMVMK